MRKTDVDLFCEGFKPPSCSSGAQPAALPECLLSFGLLGLLVDVAALVVAILDYCHTRSQDDPRATARRLSRSLRHLGRHPGDRARVARKLGVAAEDLDTLLAHARARNLDWAKPLERVIRSRFPVPHPPTPKSQIPFPGVT